MSQDKHMLKGIKEKGMIMFVPFSLSENGLKALTFHKDFCSKRSDLRGTDLSGPIKKLISFLMYTQNYPIRRTLKALLFKEKNI